MIWSASGDRNDTIKPFLVSGAGDKPSIHCVFAPARTHHPSPETKGGFVLTQAKLQEVLHYDETRPDQCREAIR